MSNEWLGVTSCLFTVYAHWWSRPGHPQSEVFPGWWRAPPWRAHRSPPRSASGSTLWPPEVTNTVKTCHATYTTLVTEYLRAHSQICQRWQRTWCRVESARQPPWRRRNLKIREESYLTPASSSSSSITRVTFARRPVGNRWTLSSAFLLPHMVGYGSRMWQQLR